MKDFIHLLLRACTSGLILLVLLFAGFWIANDDYYPVYRQIQIGMSEDQVAELLGDISVKKSALPDRKVSWYFQEPDLFPAYFFLVVFRDGKVISKEDDL